MKKIRIAAIFAVALVLLSGIAAAGAGAKETIKVTDPRVDQVVQSPLLIKGEARGSWYFEGSFPVKLLDGRGQLLAKSEVYAQADWMTENFVPFTAKIEFKTTPATEDGALILQKANPSGLPEYADELIIPVKFTKPVEPSLTITSPNGGEKIQIGSTYEIKWSCNFPYTHTADILLYKGDNYYGEIGHISTVGCINGQTDSYSWNTQDIKGGINEGNDYWIRIILKNSQGEVLAGDISDYYFGIAPAETPAIGKISVVSPNGGEKWQTGKIYQIEWKSKNIPAGKNTHIYLLKQSANGAYDTVAKELYHYVGNYKNKIGWTISNDIPADSYKIQIVVSLPNVKISDTSDAPFKILGNPTLLERTQ